jgi:hypothetical protein
MRNEAVGFDAMRIEVAGYVVTQGTRQGGQGRRPGALAGCSRAAGHPHQRIRDRCGMKWNEVVGYVIDAE